MNSVTIVPIIIILIIFNMTTTTTSAIKTTKEYYYTRTRTDSNHLRVSETVKNNFVSDIKYESKINGTSYEYYMSSLTMSHDELVFEVIDKMFRHRLSPFYIHHYDNEEDRKHSSDVSLVSQETCARDLLYLLDNLPKLNDRNYIDPFSRTEVSSSNSEQDNDQISPELDAFFDSYAKQEPGLLMGNTYWVGAYDQCVNRQIFELTKSTPQSSSAPIRRPREVSATGEPRNNDPQVISFKGRYCVASLRAPVWERIIEERKQQDRLYFKTDRQFETYAHLFRLQLGICLPSTCDSYAYDRHHDEIKLLATAQLDQRYTNYDLIDLYCLPDESSQLRRWSGSAIGFIVFMAVWLTCIFLATLADVFDFVDTTATMALDKKRDAEIRKRTTTVQKLVSWFSLRSNYRKLMLVKCDEEQDDKDGKGRDEKQTQLDEDRNKVGRIDKSPDTKSSKTNERQQQQSSPDGSAKPTSCNGDQDTDEKPANTEQFNINLRFLNAFKVMIMFWIVNGHIMLLMIQTAKNILYSDALLNGLMYFLIGATFGVDLFFTMTGFLASYLIFNSGQAKRLRLTTWLYMFFHRYWRLAPMYLLTFWFSRSVMQLLGSGPLWDYGTSGITFRGLCNQESWFYPLTLTSNLHGLFEECMIQSWYISCDMQFWLASPIFIYLLAKTPLYGWAASIASILISCKARYDIIVAEKSARHDELVKPRADIFMRVSHDMPALYTHPQYRIGTYIIGMLAGHYVYMVKSGRWKTSMLAKHRSVPVETTPTSNEDVSKIEEVQKSTRRKKSSKRQVAAFVGAALVLMMSFAPYLLAHCFPYSLIDYRKGLAGLAYAIQHLVMSFGFSLVIIAMCFGQWPRLVKFLSHPNWTRLSKINYAILLLQCEAIYYQIFRYDQVPLAGTKELINILLNLLLTLYPLAFAVTIIFEFPLANIEKLLI